jgi:hypothetical protein
VKLIHCIYASRGNPALSEASLPALLDSARRNNLSLDITGMLLFIEGSFFQVLEGDAPAVDRLYASIARDPRHDRVTQIIREPIAQRSFAEWSMGFVSMTRTHAQSLVGENDFFGSAACLQRVTPGRAKRLLTAFAAGRWRTDHTGEHRAHARVG